MARNHQPRKYRVKIRYTIHTEVEVEAFNKEAAIVQVELYGPRQAASDYKVLNEIVDDRVVSATLVGEKNGTL